MLSFPQFAAAWILPLLLVSLLTTTGNAQVAIGASAVTTNKSSKDDAVYVWQRVYSEELLQVIAAEQTRFAEFRLLAIQQQSDGSWIELALPLPQLKNINSKLIPVIRLPGSKTLPGIEQLQAKINGIIKRWQAAGIKLERIEIDFDCAESQLANYTATLTTLRTWLAPQQLALDITALPSWLKNKQFPALLAVADRVTLQVHSVQVPSKGLFDARKAEFWIRSLDALSSKAFTVALPAYGAKLLLDSKNKVIGVEHEAELAQAASSTVEVQTDPNAVQALLEALKKTRTQNAVQFVWFRLPVPSDQRAWKLVTLHAVMEGQKLFGARKINSLANKSGSTDIEVESIGNIPMTAPLRVTAPANCTGDGVNGYQFKPGVFVSSTARELRPGERMVIGWMRCSKVEEEN